jgi:hypothetical protein
VLLLGSWLDVTRYRYDVIDNFRLYYFCVYTRTRRLCRRVSHIMECDWNLGLEQVTKHVGEVTVS